jgi:hypothetical protein
MEFNELKKPFSSYDLFGYFTPGVVIIVGVYIHTRLFKITLLENLKCILIPYWPSQWYEYAVFVFLGVLIVYVIGHLVASISSALIDSMLVRRMHGYPYQKLFSKYFPVGDNDQRRRLFAKTSFGVFFVGLFLLAIRRAPLVLAEIALATSLMLMFLRMIYTILMDRKHSTVAGLIYWTSCPLWILFGYPYWYIIKTFGALFRMNKPFADWFQDRFFQAFDRCFGVNPLIDDKEKHPPSNDRTYIDSNCYWLTYCYVIDHSPESAKMIAGWLNLYSFARNTGMAFFLLFLYGAIIGRSESMRTNETCCVWTITTGALSVAFTLRFYYLYYKYYSKHIFRAFVTLDAVPPRNPPISAKGP